MNDRFELTLGQLLGFARRGLYFGLALALLLGAGLFQWQSRSGPIYEAQAAIVVQSPQVHLSSIGLPEINYSPLHVDAYRVVALSDQTIAAGLRAIGQPATPATVGELRQGGLQVRAILESRLLYILVAADSPQKAADLANAIAAQLQTWDLARVTEELRAVTQLLSQSATVQQLIIQELQGQEGAEAATQLGNAQRQVSDLRAQMDSVVALATNAMSNLQVLEAATPPEESAGRTPVMLAL